METVEIIVYIFIAIIVAGSLAAMLKTIDHKEQYQTYVKTFKNDDGNIFKIDSTQFAGEVAKRWEDCRFGMDNKTYSVFVTDNSTLTREDIILEFKRVDKCNVIDCYNRKNGFILENNITTPKIINIRCFNNSLIINKRG
jgi:hypothetical protein